MHLYTSDLGVHHVSHHKPNYRVFANIISCTLPYFFLLQMSYNKIRAMNFIAKLGIKPPPGFITEIPPMNENNNELVEPEVCALFL